MTSRGRGRHARGGPRRGEAAAPPAGAGPSRGAGGDPAIRALEIALVVAAGLLAVFRAREQDFWFHLAAGRDIVRHGIPATERWCLAAFGQWPWLGEWLYHVCLYLVRSVSGDPGVAVWRALWSALAMGLALALARAVRAGFAGTLLLSPLVFAVLRGRLVARPEQVTLALALLFLLVFERSRRGPRDRTPWLLPVQALWANLHPGWVLGPAIAALFAALEPLGRAPGSGRRALRWAALALALYAAGAIGPRPLDALSMRLVRDVGADPMMVTIEELRSWSWPEDHAHPFTAVLAVAVVAALVGARRAWRSSPPLAVAAVAGLAAGVASYRLRALGTIASLPALSAALAVPWPVGRPGPRAGARSPAAPLAAVAALAAAVAGVAWLVADAKFFVPGAAPFLDSVPVRAVALADSLGLEGPVLNTAEVGGYVLWVRGPRHLPLADARHLGSAAFRSRFVRARLDPAALDSLLAEWRFTHAILEPPADPLDHLAGFLFHRPDWALVFADDAGLLFVRRDAAPAVAEARGYRVLSPDYAERAALAGRALRDTTLERALLAELDRERSGSPWTGRASLWLGLLALGHGDPRGALEDFARVERVAPATPGLALRQGLAHEMLGDRAAAARDYRRALRDTADARAAREALRSLGGRPERRGSDAAPD